MNLLSEFDVAVLQAARRVLEDLVKVAGADAMAEGDRWQGVNLGRLQQQAETTEWQVFQVLNVATSRCHDERATAALEATAAPELDAARAELGHLLCLDAEDRLALRMAAAEGGSDREHECRCNLRGNVPHEMGSAGCAYATSGPQAVA